MLSFRDKTIFQLRKLKTAKKIEKLTKSLNDKSLNYEKRLKIFKEIEYKKGYIDKLEKRIKNEIIL